jgi:hypothetical protein
VKDIRIPASLIVSLKFKPWSRLDPGMHQNYKWVQELLQFVISEEGRERWEERTR